MANIEKIKLTWQDIEDTVDILAKELSDKKFDAVISIGRGGMIPARLIAEKLDIHAAFIIDAKAYNENDELCNVEITDLELPKNIYNIVVIDDCIFTGTTLDAVTKKILKNEQILYVVNAFLYKNKNVPDIMTDYIYAKEYDGNTKWLVFPWEKN